MRRKTSIPRRRIGERTLNDAIYNAARHLRWLAPRLMKRKYGPEAETCCVTADQLEALAGEHERAAAREVV